MGMMALYEHYPELATFINEQCLYDKGSRQGGQELFEAWQNWSERRGIRLYVKRRSFEGAFIRCLEPACAWYICGKKYWMDFRLNYRTGTGDKIELVTLKTIQDWYDSLPALKGPTVEWGDI